MNESFFFIFSLSSDAIFHKKEEKKNFYFYFVLNLGFSVIFEVIACVVIDWHTKKQERMEEDERALRVFFRPFSVTDGEKEFHHQQWDACAIPVSRHTHTHTGWMVFRYFVHRKRHRSDHQHIALPSPLPVYLYTNDHVIVFFYSFWMKQKGKEQVPWWHRHATWQRTVEWNCISFLCFYKSTDTFIFVLFILTMNYVDHRGWWRNDLNISFFLLQVLVTTFQMTTSNFNENWIDLEFEQSTCSTKEQIIKRG